MEFLKKHKDTTEFVKQQEKKQELVLVDNIQPYNNHITFEINLKDKTIDCALIENIKEIHWFEIINNTYQERFIVKKKDYLYVSALNHKNLIKRVKKLYNIDISDFEYIPKQKSLVGSSLNINIKDIKS